MELDRSLFRRGEQRFTRPVRFFRLRCADGQKCFRSTRSNSTFTRSLHARTRCWHGVLLDGGHGVERCAALDTEGLGLLFADARVAKIFRGAMGGDAMARFAEG